MHRLFLSGVETAEGADRSQTEKRLRARLRRGNIGGHSRLVSALWVFRTLNVQIENALSPEVFYRPIYLQSSVSAIEDYSLEW
jgi:hypothetical protein